MVGLGFMTLLGGSKVSVMMIVTKLFFVSMRLICCFLHGASSAKAKSALGPNGRGNPIVRVINANRTQSNSVSHLDVKRSRTAGCQTILPRIISGW